MATKKYYAIKVGRKPGIYTTWDEAKAQVAGFKGAIYKSFPTMEEAQAFAKDDGEMVSGNAALNNLSKVQVKLDTGKFASINAPAVKEALPEYWKMVLNKLKEAYEAPVDITSLIADRDVEALEDKYGLHLEDLDAFQTMSGFDAISFVDGGGDKVGVGFESTKILFSTVFYDAKEKRISFYRALMEKGNGFDWLFRASNVAGEELAALLAMFVARKKGLKKLNIYQDNNLPAKYFSGEFVKINKPDDFMLRIFILMSMRMLADGQEIGFTYVPSEHSMSKTAAQKKKMYEMQAFDKMKFEDAEFYNGISDILADFSKV